MRPHDLHVHTPLSGCGVVTATALRAAASSAPSEGVPSGLLLRELTKLVVLEYFDAARGRGLEVLGFTDHWTPWTSPDTFDWLRAAISELPKPGGLQVYVAAEVDVLSSDGRLAAPERELARLDYVLAAPHHYHLSYVEQPPCDLEGLLEHAMRELEAVIRSLLVDAVAHPWAEVVGYARERCGLSVALADIPEEYLWRTCELAERRWKALQVQYDPGWEREGHPMRGTLRFLRIAAESGCPLFFGSDAHRPADLARGLEHTLRALGRLGVRPDRLWLPERA